MLRLALRLLAASVVFFAVGYLDSGRVWCEVVRVAAVAGMTVSFVLLIVNYLRTADPSTQGRD